MIVLILMHCTINHLYHSLVCILGEIRRMLLQQMNVLADMSDGALPRINSLPKDQSMRANNAQDFGVGEQLAFFCWRFCSFGDK